MNCVVRTHTATNDRLATYDNANERSEKQKEERIEIKAIYLCHLEWMGFGRQAGNFKCIVLYGCWCFSFRFQFKWTINAIEFFSFCRSLRLYFIFCFYFSVSLSVPPLLLISSIFVFKDEFENMMTMVWPLILSIVKKSRKIRLTAASIRRFCSATQNEKKCSRLYWIEFIFDEWIFAMNMFCRNH